MSRRTLFLLFAPFLSCLVTGCRTSTVGSAAGVEDEPTVVFGGSTTSAVRSGLKILYEKSTYNSAGFLTAEVGFRNVAGDGLLESSSSLTFTVQCNFYDTLLGPGGGPIIYGTGIQTKTLKPGETWTYQSVCPMRAARVFQIMIGGTK